MNHLDMIRDFSNANGVSGFEDEVVLVARKYADPTFEVSKDSLLNFYIRRPENNGKRPVIQLDGHSDEVGFMVQAIRPNGTLQFITIGGWVNSNIPAHKVRVKTVNGDYIPGIVAAKPPHFMSVSEKGRTPEVSEMAIDIGASSLREAHDEFGVRMAAPVVPDVAFTYDEKHDLMIGKAFDCRLGCAAILATMDALKGEDLGIDIVGAMSVQEEVGCRGSRVTANTVKPDVAIVFEGCPADDTVQPDYLIQTAIHKGPMLRHIDTSMITNPRFQKYALDLARELNIPVQESVRTGGSTNGASIHLSGEGVPVIVIGLPVRYIHSHYGIAAYEDFENAVKLAVEIIRRLNKDIIGSF
ncbi:MAG: M20/M25/M40 family metallo-hydrolase [Clostridia bacterium]|nr:M20/M25/M40 family metallo-hydrolase [Clostridia bacterium]